MSSPRVWIGVLVSAASIAFLFLTVDFGELGAALGRADPMLVLACASTLPVTMWMKAYRWRYFFPEPDRVTMYGLLSALCLGYMANTVVPLRAGELLRAYLVGESEGVSKSTVLATVLIEKVLDLGSIALFLFVLRFAIPLPEWADAAAIASGVGIVVAAVGLAVALLARDRALELLRRVEQRIPPLRRLGASALLEAFLDGLAFVRKPRVLAIVVAWSVILWLGAGLTVYLGLLAVGIATTVGLATFVLVVTNLGMAVPSAPGYVGVFHSAVVLALTPFGVDRAQATAAAIILHAIIFGAFIVGGLAFIVLARDGRSSDGGLGEMMARARSSTGDGPAH